MDHRIRSAAGLTPLGRPSCRRAVRLAIVLGGLVLRTPLAASQGPPLPPSLPLPPGAYSHLADAARDSRHADGESVPPVSSGVPEKATNADGRWVAGPRLLHRSWHSAIYDPVGDRMVVFGGGLWGWWQGESFNDVWAMPLHGPTTWAEVRPLGVQPSPRLGHSAIYDPVRKRMVVCGGFSSSAFDFHDDVWALSLSGVPTWTELHPGGTPPVGAYGQCAVYDPARDRMIVATGFDVSALSLGGSPTWTNIPTTGVPQNASVIAAVYDPVRDRLVVIGFEGSPGCGNHDEQDYQKAWALSLGGDLTWTELAPGGPAPRVRVQGCTAIYDPPGDRVVIFGGNCGTSGEDMGSPWALSLGGTPQWTPLTDSPFVRSYHSAIFDPVRHRMVVFGGNWDDYRISSDVWTMSLAGTTMWTQVLLAPMASDFATTVYDPVRRQMVMSRGPGEGGRSYREGSKSTLMALSLGDQLEWKDLSPPGERSWLLSIYDPVRDRMIGGDYSGVMALSLAQGPVWSLLTPEVHVGFSIYDPVRDRMVVVGPEVWALPLSGTPTWTDITPPEPGPEGLWDASVIYDPLRDRIIVFGGRDAGYLTSDVWTLSLSGDPVWSKLISIGTAPCPRVGDAAVYDSARDRMVVFGGDGWRCGTDGVWALSLGETPTWTLLAPTGQRPPQRMFHHAIYDPACDRMVVFGGDDPGGEPIEDTWTLQWGTCNRPPDVSAAVASEPILWPADHQLRPVSILGVTDPDGDPVTITVTRVTQDEPADGVGDGASCPDAQILNHQASVRSERSGSGNGRVYAIRFTAEDGRGGGSDGTVTVCVPHNEGDAACPDDGQRYDSSGPCLRHVQLPPQAPSLEVDPVSGPQASIHFGLPAGGVVEVAVFDVAGRRRATIESGELTSGTYDRVWRLDGVPKGLYFVRMRTGATTVTQRVLVAR